MPQGNGEKPSSASGLPKVEAPITQAKIDRVVSDPDVAEGAREDWLKRALARLLEDANPGAEQRRLVREVRDIIKDRQTRR